MFIINSYSLAVLFCIITMLCWGSWANTSKVSTSKWPFPLFYWDYSLGLIIMALIYGITIGSLGTGGRSFLEDLLQADGKSIFYALLGGAVFNLSNLLVVAAIAVAGLSVAFPIAVGLALVLGVIINYIKVPTGNPILLFLGVGLVVIAMVVNAMASGKASASKGANIEKRDYNLRDRWGNHVILLQVCIRGNDNRFHHSGIRKTYSLYRCFHFFSRGVFIKLYLEQLFYVPAGYRFSCLLPELFYGWNTETTSDRNSGRTDFQYGLSVQSDCF